MTDLRKLLAEATRPFPWRAAVSGDILTTGREWIVASVNGQDPYEDDANAALIVAAVNALPALLDVAEAARALRDAEIFIDGDPDAYWMQAAELRDALDRLEEALRWTTQTDTTSGWRCSCGFWRPMTGSYGCPDCNDGRPDADPIRPLETDAEPTTVESPVWAWLDRPLVVAWFALALGVTAALGCVVAALGVAQVKGDKG